MKQTVFAWLVFLGAFTAPLNAHDTWVQTASLVARHRDVVHIDLMLGNHGNGHRDFKLASKISLDPCTLVLIAPDGTREDLKSKVVDMGSAAKEGFWTAKTVAQQPGLYQIVHTLDTLHGTTRAIKTAKSYFISTSSFNSLPPLGSNPVVPLQKGMELVLESPVDRIAAGEEIRMRLLWNGKPLPNVVVSFIPRGAKLAEGLDSQFEKTSDSNGFIAYTPSEGNYLLAVAHHPVADEKGDGYDKTHYTATLVLAVPQLPFGSMNEAIPGTQKSD